MASTADAAGPDFSPRALVPGFAPFTVRTTRVHALGVVGGVLVWLGSYALTARIATGSAGTVVGTAATFAAAVTSVYFITLFSLAVGTPLGDVAAPLFLAVGTPGFLYRALVPPTVPGLSAVTPFGPTGGAAIGAAVVAVVVPVAGVALVYHRKDNSVEWEQETMPHSFSILRTLGLADDPHPPASTVTESDYAGYSRLILIFVGLVLLAPVALALVPPAQAVRPSDVAGTLLIVAVLAYVWGQ